MRRVRERRVLCCCADPARYGATAPRWLTAVLHCRVLRASTSLLRVDLFPATTFATTVMGGRQPRIADKLAAIVIAAGCCGCGRVPARVALLSDRPVLRRRGLSFLQTDKRAKTGRTFAAIIGAGAWNNGDDHARSTASRRLRRRTPATSYTPVTPTSDREGFYMPRDAGGVPTAVDRDRRSSCARDTGVTVIVAVGNGAISEHHFAPTHGVLIIVAFTNWHRRGWRRDRGSGVADRFVLPKAAAIAVTKEVGTLLRLRGLSSL